MSTRLKLSVAMLLVAAATLSGCSGPTRHGTMPDGPSLAAQPSGDLLVQAWGQQLASYVDRAGHGDPAALAQLPMLRSAPGLRPAQIVFRANDLAASQPGQDGFDLSGLLLGRQQRDGQTWYVFVVGAVARDDGRPVALTDLRLMALSLQNGQPVWRSSAPDAQALRRYDEHLGAQRVLRFPAENDRFALQPCAPAICVEEATSGARWRLD